MSENTWSVGAEMGGVNLSEVVQAAIAIIVVLGGGAACILVPESRNDLLPLITFVIGYYFSTNSVKRGVEIGEKIPVNSKG